MQKLAPATKIKKTLPEWLDLLLRENFFAPCSLHNVAKKNEKNVFCIDCATSLCSQCLLSHSSHRLLQVRRYVYHDVIRLEDAQKLLDCSLVQPYISNGAKVVFLNQRPTSRPHTNSGNICGPCDRVLQEPFLYCSVSCKVDHILQKEGIEALFDCLRRCDFLPLPEIAQLTVGHLTSDSVLEPSSNSALSTSNSSGRNVVVSNVAGLVESHLVFPRKKRTPKITIRVDPHVSRGSSDGSGGNTPSVKETNNSNKSSNRRKRAPQRSPLV